jgi:hypothetical protein
MSEWLDVAVYAMLTVAIWAWVAAWSSRLAASVIADRNPGWAADQLSNERGFATSRWFRWACLFWGATSLVLLLALQIGAWPQQLAFVRATSRWEALQGLNSALIVLGFVFVAGRAALFYRWLHAHVPLSTRRQARLERRSIDDYVSRPLRYAVYAVIVLHLATWTAVGVIGRYAAPAFWAELVFQCVVSAVSMLFVMGAVRRRPGTMDRIFGPGYRWAEVRIALAAQLLPLVNGVARLYEQIIGTPLQQIDRFLHLGLALFIVAFVIALAVWLRQPGDQRPARRSRPAASVGVVILVWLITRPWGSGVMDAQVSFETCDDGRGRRVVLHENGVDQRARRLD